MPYWDLEYASPFTQSQFPHTPRAITAGMFGTGDFDDGASSQGGPTKRQRREADGEPRAFLRVFETAPAQMLNAFGQGQFVYLSDEKMWHALCQALPTGAKYGTELADQEYMNCSVG